MTYETFLQKNQPVYTYVIVENISDLFYTSNAANHGFVFSWVFSEGYKLLRAFSRMRLRARFLERPKEDAK